MKCRKCGKDGAEIKRFGYWPPYEEHYYHEECKSGHEEEVVTLQTLDADCNDCFFFKRGEMLSKGIFDGWCKKYDKETKAYPNFCSNHKCFKHRKS